MLEIFSTDIFRLIIPYIPSLVLKLSAPVRSFATVRVVTIVHTFNLSDLLSSLLTSQITQNAFVVMEADITRKTMRMTNGLQEATTATTTTTTTTTEITM